MDNWTVKLSRTVMPETLSETTDESVQKLHDHMPRVVENQQRLGYCRAVGLRSLRVGTAVECVPLPPSLPIGTAPVLLNRGRVRCVYLDCPDGEPWYPAI
jgi:hypothetical protein